MKIWLNILVSLILIPLCSLSNIDNFEGKIKIIKESVYDTLQIEVSVKNNIVRIDELNGRGAINRSYLVDLSKEKVVALSLKEKLYAEIPLNTAQKKSTVEFIKTQNSMKVNGVDCYQWRVRDKSKNSEITYWVAQRDFGFMKALFSILSRSQTPLAIFGQFPLVNGYLPLLSVDRTLLRKVKESTRIVNITQIKLSENLFAIPPDFRELVG